jgi:hypothetical protein
MAEILKVEVIALRPHVERQRRERGDRYFVKPERVDYVVAKGWVKVVSELLADVETEVEARAEAETEEKAAEDERLEESTVDDLAPEWTVGYSPQEYLRRWPEGPKAELAQAILDKLAQE